MKKLFTALMITTFTFAGTTAQLNLKGTIGQVVDISISADAGATTLDLTTTASDLKVADVTEQSNSNTGYSVTVTSANGGNLEHSNGDQFPYTMKYDGSAVDLSSGSTFTNGTTGLIDTTKEASVSYTGQAASTLVSGDYTDTVTFTISAN